jgi:hypothetical protein
MRIRYSAVYKGMSWVTNSALVDEPKCGGGVAGSANEYSCAHGAQINFGDRNLCAYISKQSRYLLFVSVCFIDLHSELIFFSFHDDLYCLDFTGIELLDVAPGGVCPPLHLELRGRHPLLPHRGAYGQLPHQQQVLYPVRPLNR